MVDQSQPPSGVSGFRDGYYEGATERGDEVAFIVRSPDPDPEPDRQNFPWQVGVIANFRANLTFLVMGDEEGDVDETLRFKAEDVPVIDNGSFMQPGEEGPLLFALNGLLFPDGPGGHASGHKQLYLVAGRSRHNLGVRV